MDIAGLKASQLLDDCQRALELLETVPEGDAQLFRIYWTFCLVALRSVEDALIKSDAKQYPALMPLLKKRHAELEELKGQYSEDSKYEECDSEDYLVYHRLVRGERNSVVHEASQAYVDGMWMAVAPDAAVNMGNIYLPMWDFDKWGGDDCRVWLQRGIDWWRKEIVALVKGVEHSSKRKRK